LSSIDETLYNQIVSFYPMIAVMGVCARISACLPAGRYDTSEKELRVRSPGLRKQKQHNCSEARM
jgi:hypothetical protein